MSYTAKKNRVRQGHYSVITGISKKIFKNTTHELENYSIFILNLSKSFVFSKEWIFGRFIKITAQKYYYDSDAIFG